MVSRGVRARRPISAIGRSHKSESAKLTARLRVHRPAGFTLLELLVVLVIVAVMTTVAMVSINAGLKPDRDGGDCVAFLRNLRQALEWLADEAVMDQKEYGLDIKDGRVRFFEVDLTTGQFVADGKSLKEIPMPEAGYGRLLIAGREVKLKAETETPSREPKILILSSGEVTPFEWSFYAFDAGKRIAGLDVSPLGGTQLVLEPK